MQVSLYYTGVEARRYNQPDNSVSVNNNSTIVDVAEEKEQLIVKFVFVSNFEPNIGVIRIEGEVHVDEEEKTRKNALEEWGKTGKKKLPKDMAERLHNIIVSNCLVESTVLSREVHLPPTIPTPSVSLTNQQPVDKGADDTDKYIR